MSIFIRPTKTIEDYQAIEQLQVDIWGDSVGVAPTPLLLTIAKESGVVLLAFDDDTPIGFAFGFLALTDDRRLKMASHQVGVLPEYQGTGAGYRLKLAQRQAMLDQNIELITWTFDPLQGRNARLNLRKLGAVCNTYIPNLYGQMDDDLNQGLPTDRFRVDWWVATPHVAQRLAGQVVEPDRPSPECPLLNPSTTRANGLPAPPDSVDSPATGRCLVEVPPDINVLKEQAPDLALKWRLHTREIFKTAFAQGYTAVDLLRREACNYYLLQKDWKPAQW